MGNVCAEQSRVIISAGEGYHQYGGRLSSVWWKVIISMVEGYITTEDVQYSGRLSSVQWSEYYQYIEGIPLVGLYPEVSLIN